jgi:hypothetical protein
MLTEEQFLEKCQALRIRVNIQKKIAPEKIAIGNGEFVGSDQSPTPIPGSDNSKPEFRYPDAEPWPGPGVTSASVMNDRSLWIMLQL